MTQHERKVMQMAFEALESSRVFVTSREKIKHPEGTEWYDERIEALRACLAQPVKEWVGLTDEEIRQVWYDDSIEGTYIDKCRQVEAKLKEKNT